MMAIFISETDVSSAWVAALDALVRAGGDAANLTVGIADPTAEDKGVRQVLDRFIADQRRAKPRTVQRVSTVANTIFPSAWYRPDQLGPDAADHLYELERTTRAVSHRRNLRGTYFERMVAWPGPDRHEFNQLDQAIRRLRSVRARGHERGHAYEVGVTMPTDEIAMPVIVAGKDRSIIGFPCLSHLSFSLLHGVVNLLAVYRSHYFVSRAYGNYVGLGRVLQFVAGESGFPAGELTCVSASATAEMQRGGSFGTGRVTALLDDCRAALGMAS
jgi:thymidylate synthase